MNNKMIKGSVAGATGIVLLMGGFGTYALWSDSTTLDHNTLKSGALDVVSTGTASWADVSTTGATSSDWNPSSDFMVPGDKVRLTQPVELDVAGKNLKVKFAVTGVNATAADWTNLGVTMKYDGQELTPVTGPGFEHVYNAPAGASLDGTKDLVVTFDFPDTVDTTVDQNKTLDLNAVGIAVTQVRP